MHDRGSRYKSQFALFDPVNMDGQRFHQKLDEDLPIGVLLLPQVAAESKKHFSLYVNDNLANTLRFLFHPSLMLMRVKWTLFQILQLKGLQTKPLMDIYQRQARFLRQLQVGWHFCWQN